MEDLKVQLAERATLLYHEILEITPEIKNFVMQRPQTFEEYEQLVYSYQHLQRKTQLYNFAFNFALGDLCNYAREKFGEKWVSAFSDIGVDSRIWKIALTARVFPPSERDPRNLTYFHYEELRRVPEPYRKQLLKKSQEEKLSIAELRRQVRMLNEGFREEYEQKVSTFNDEHICSWGTKLFVSLLERHIANMSDEVKLSEILAKAARFLAMKDISSSNTQVVARNAFYRFYERTGRRPNIDELYAESKEFLKNVKDAKSLYSIICASEWNYFVKSKI